MVIFNWVQKIAGFYFDWLSVQVLKETQYTYRLCNNN